MSQGNPLFPQFLNARSEGPAVATLQTWLKILNYNRDGIVVDGVYGPETQIGVQALQAFLGFPKADRDGHFGPVTRQAFKNEYGLDINALPRSVFLGLTHAVGP